MDISVRKGVGNRVNMLNNIKIESKKETILLVYLEYILRNTYLCSRFQKGRLW